MVDRVVTLCYVRRMGARLKFQSGELISGTMLSFLMDSEVASKIRRAVFKCECGNEIERPLHYVVHKFTSSCGCLKRQILAGRNTKHGQAKRGNPSGSYRSWQAMTQRVGSAEAYKDVKICPEWSGEFGFVNFFNDMGERPNGLTLDRINPFGEYSPKNCRWADRRTQANNTRGTIRLEWNGKIYAKQDLIREIGIHPGTVKSRIRKGMNLIEAITTPINKSKSHANKRKKDNQASA